MVQFWPRFKRVPNVRFYPQNLVALTLIGRHLCANDFESKVICQPIVRLAIDC